MRKQYFSAPLPFQGQKRMFAKEYIKVLHQLPDSTTFVDLFGGSGLLSHIAKCEKPNSTVVYNDFDGYRLRLEHIPQTNELLAELRKIVDVPRRKPILGEMRERVLSCIRRHERIYGYVDYITLSSSVMFSMKYATKFSDFEKETCTTTSRLLTIRLVVTISTGWSLPPVIIRRCLNDTRMFRVWFSSSIPHT